MPGGVVGSLPGSLGQPRHRDRGIVSVLAVINQARAQARLPAYAILTGLQTSARKHNLLMAGGCGLSNQCPGESALGDRETAAGVLSSTFTSTGIAIYRGSDGTVWMTQDFAN